MEPPRRGASLLHNVNNQISQDGEPRTDSWSVISTYTCGPRRLPGDRWGTQQAQGLCRGHSKSHLLSASLIPEPQEGRDQQTGCVTERVGSHLSRKRVPSAFLPRARPHRKVGRQEQSCKRTGAVCHSHSHGGEICSWRVPDPGASRNGPASMPVSTPKCGTRPGAVGAEDTGLLVLCFLPGD